MNAQLRHIFNEDLLEKKVLEASEAIRKNAERGKVIRLRRERLIKERNKTIFLEQTSEEEEAEDEQE